MGQRVQKISTYLVKTNGIDFDQTIRYGEGGSACLYNPLIKFIKITPEVVEYESLNLKF